MGPQSQSQLKQSGNQSPCFPAQLSTTCLRLCLSHLDGTCFPNLVLPEESESQSH